MRSGRPLIIGKLSNITSNSTASKLIAAKPHIKKRVYWIDNFHNSVSVKDICSLIAGLSIKVISCFETKPRKRRFDTSTDDHITFRFCIACEDKERLLDSTVWPEHVFVSEWFFKFSQKSSSSTVIQAFVAHAAQKPRQCI